MRCPVCNSIRTYQLINMGKQPLSVTELKDTQIESFNLPVYPIKIDMCSSCHHVFNTEFDNRNVQYAGQGCKMFNNGSGWNRHLDTVRYNINTNNLDLLIEIGAGDCSFLNSIDTDAIKVAIDLCEDVKKAEEYGITYKKEIFDASKHIPLTSGNLVILMRHILEHVEKPKDFLESIVETAKARLIESAAPTSTQIVIEVPCCDNAIRNTRIEDWTYEHPQHFTMDSMLALLRQCNVENYWVTTSYNDEVLIATADIYPKQSEIYNIINKYNKASLNIAIVGGWIIENNIHDIAFWGGAGKSAMFLRKFGVPSDAIVVDSHEAKQGYYVPGTKILIQNPDVLKHMHARYIIATTSWRANDIRDEILDRGIPCKGLFKFEEGKLKEVSLGH